ncbi:trichohyalin-like [Anopheles nili]|uniref:trichohyalin-like n=1 Tax=Anopheles nili TaxID=185578 RepID=UPI00237B7CEB|nr:trichohyalin-like [Anopheles nili]
MFLAKVILLATVLALFGGVAAQVTRETVPRENAEASSAEPVELVTERFNATRVLSAIRQEIERRREERQERTQQRREEILQTLEGLSERRREFELRRQEAEQAAEALKEARRQDMEARRVGRLPQRERERVSRLRLERLVDQTTPEENEIDDSASVTEEENGELGELRSSGVVQRVRNLLLIEEADGNLRLIDLDTEEGQQYVLEGGRKREQESDGSEEKQQDEEEKKSDEENEKKSDEEEKGAEIEEAAGKRKLKIGQI